MMGCRAVNQRLEIGDQGSTFTLVTITPLNRHFYTAQIAYSQVIFAFNKSTKS